MNEEYRNIFILVVTIIFCVIMYFAQKYSYVTDQGLLIACFGILATFVVIGNYAQTKDAKDKVEQMQTDVKKIIKDMYNDEAKPIFQETKEKNENEIKRIVAECLAENNKSYNSVINLLFGEIVSKEQAEIIKALAENRTYECKVINPATRHENNAKAEIDANNKIVFRKKNNSEIVNVAIVNGQPYDEDDWLKKIQLWKDICLLIPRDDMALNQAFDQQIH